jgi:hypothetical protein
MSGTKLHWVWKAMHQRCLNVNCKDYKNYGARGISIASAWADFSAFYQWCISTGYEEGLTIERIDVNGDYEPSNCGWIDNVDQALNTRKVRLLTYNNQTKPLTIWAKEVGISPSTIKGRLRRGWTIEKALTVKPVIGRNQHR